MRGTGLSMHILFNALLGMFSVSLQYAQEPKNQAQSWSEVKNTKRGAITVFWYESRPFIYRSAMGMEGIEYEILEGFKRHLKQNHNVDLRIVWKEAHSFGD